MSYGCKAYLDLLECFAARVGSFTGHVPSLFVRDDSSNSSFDLLLSLLLFQCFSAVYICSFPK